MPLAEACLVILLVATLAQTSLAAQSSIAPVTASMVVRLPAGKTTYYIGEEIPLELEFRGTSGDEDYSFSTANVGSRTALTASDYAHFAVDFSKRFLTWCESVTFFALAAALNALMKSNGRRTLSKAYLSIVHETVHSVNRYELVYIQSLAEMMC